MGKYDTIGQLMHLPLECITVEEKFFESEFVLNASAEAVLATNGHNWIPVIVKETGDYQYQVVANHFIFAVAEQAALERVWCIIIEPEFKAIEQAQILAKEKTPKINLSTASGDSILSALRHLISESGSPLKGVDVVVAANRIEEANRSQWTDLSPIPKLKCGITKGKKLDALDKIFFVEAPPPPPPAPEVISISKASREEVFSRLSYLSKHSIGGFEKIDADQATNAIFAAAKAKWKSLNPITKLDCGIDTGKIKTLKKVFSV